MKKKFLLLGAVGVLFFLALDSLVFAGNGQWTVVVWNNLGMHCMDDDYSVFSILPPFNTLNAQVMDAAGKLVTNSAALGLIVTYEAIEDPDGSKNTTTAGKSNFYQYCQALYGPALAVDQGLAGHSMPGPSNTPQPMTWDAAMGWFEATGVPIAPTDDMMRKNSYPLMRVSVRNSGGIVLASADVVLPVSDEMDCRACHSSTSGPEAMPAAGWVNDPVDKRDFRLNILRLHDEHQAANPYYAPALALAGYAPQGLHYTVTQLGKPILCASCHASEALGTAGAPGVPALTRSMHSKHATVTNPTDGLQLDNELSRNACYMCHPGSATRCLRGAMGKAVRPQDGTMEMQCQSCHGSMSQVGSASRTGWLDEPNCQACHSGDALQNEGQMRYTSVFTAAGTLRDPANKRFATTANAPAPGKSLFRFSQGHGGLTCSACHGSTHAEFPSSHRNDNLYSFGKQGHTGKLADCIVCHATMPANTLGGPHGVHPIGSSTWVNNHADLARQVGLQKCQECHGADYRGTALSRAQADRSLSTKFGQLVLKRGMEVSCYYCHNGPNSSDPSTKTGPTVASGQLAVPVNTPTSATLTASGAAPVLRIIDQPLHGTVGISGKVATYFPETDYQGPDYFTYIASDSGSFIDSKPATWSVMVGSARHMWEYAMGLNPDYGSTPRAAIESIGGVPYLTLAAQASPIRPPDVAVTFQASGDLLGWVPAVTVSTTTSQMTVRDVMSSTNATRRFLRGKVVRQTPSP